MTAIPDEARHLFEGKDLAHVATINADGSPQVSAVWIDLDGDFVSFNTVEGRLKTKNLRRNPIVALSIACHEHVGEDVIVRGKVVEMTTEGADDDIDALARRYLGVDSYPARQPGEVRVIVKIEPEKVKYTTR